MRRFCYKLKSQKGVTILFSILFFIICIMVSSTILAASASNAGKTRGEKEEQQKYFALTSALRLVCDALTEAEYTGKYTYKKEDKYTWGIWYEYTEHTYEQTKGEFKCSLSENGTNVLPLLDDLDAVFSKDFENFVDSKPKDGQDRYKGTWLSQNLKENHTLTLQVNNAENYGALKDDVTVVIKLHDGYRIRVTASIAGTDDYTNLDYDYKLEAELTPVGGSVPQPKDNPSTSSVNFTEPLKWKLNWIAKEELGTAP